MRAETARANLKQPVTIVPVRVGREIADKTLMTLEDPRIPQSWLDAQVLLYRGGVVALPTDTLYALSAVATDATAVRRVYAIKGREDGKPLPLFVDNATIAKGIAVMNEQAMVLADQFWPGALT